MKDLSDAELLAEYAKRKLERNGVCTNGYDFMKGITLGFLVGRVSKNNRTLSGFKGTILGRDDRTLELEIFLWRYTFHLSPYYRAI